MIIIALTEAFPRIYTKSWASCNAELPGCKCRCFLIDWDHMRLTADTPPVFRCSQMRKKPLPSFGEVLGTLHRDNFRFSLAGSAVMPPVTMTASHGGDKLVGCKAYGSQACLSGYCSVQVLAMCVFSDVEKTSSVISAIISNRCTRAVGIPLTRKVNRHRKP